MPLTRSKTVVDHATSRSNEMSKKRKRTSITTADTGAIRKRKVSCNALPPHWESVLKNIKKMRIEGGVAYGAVVDSMGAECLR
jgi:hypothetical protein